jgi:hypothetical protein
MLGKIAGIYVETSAISGKIGGMFGKIGAIFDKISEIFAPTVRTSAKTDETFNRI